MPASSDLAWHEKKDDAGLPTQSCERCGGSLTAITRLLTDDDVAVLAAHAEKVESAKERWQRENSRLPPKERDWWRPPLFYWSSNHFYLSDFDDVSVRFVRRLARWYEVPSHVRSGFEVITGWRPTNGECLSCKGCLRWVESEQRHECAHCHETVVVFPERYGTERKRGIRGKLRDKPLHVELVEELQAPISNERPYLIPPVSFDQLREHLHSLYLTYDLTDTRLRGAITRARREGLITVEVGRDGVPRYRPTILRSERGGR